MIIIQLKWTKIKATLIQTTEVEATATQYCAYQ